MSPWGTSRTRPTAGSVDDLVGRRRVVVGADAVVRQLRRQHVAQPPLYRIDVGKDKYWARDDAHKEEILAGLRANAKPQIMRFKGLGEMNAEELAETTLNPRTRTLLKVQIDSNLEADKVFVDLLGKDASERQRIVMEKAALVEEEDLDV